MTKGVKTGGRKAGTPNKLTKNVKEMILDALEHVGGYRYLVAQAGENPTAFLSLVGKVLPIQHTGGDDGSPPIRILTTNDDDIIKRYEAKNG